MKKNKFFIIFWVSLFIYLFVYVFGLKMFFYNIDGEFPYFFRGIIPQQANPNIVVVEMDDQTYQTLGNPIERSDYVPFLENLQSASPWVVAFDIFFADKGKDTFWDEAFIKSLQNIGNVVLWGAIEPGNKLSPPYEPFEKNARHIGYFTPSVHKYTSKVYSVKPVVSLEERGDIKVFEAFSFAALRVYYNTIFQKNNWEILEKTSSSLYQFFWKNIPIKNGEFYLRYIDPSLFHTISFLDIYEGKFEKESLKDKIILVWATAQWTKDEFLVPGNKTWEMLKGVYIHANAINNILNENYIIYFNETLEHTISFLFIFFLIYFNVTYLRQLNLKWISLGAVFLTIVILFTYIIAFLVSYQKSGVFLAPNYPFEFLSVLVISFFISSILKYINEDKNKKELSKALSTYVSSEIAQEILYSTGSVNLSWENKKITMFFSDIAWFTTISEKLTPEELVSFLRVYLWEMSHIIMDHKGFINKYEWDAIMALWGVFGETQKFGTIDACEAALLQQQKLRILNEAWKQDGQQELSVRMGIHTGNAIIGNIWAEGRKMEFTALWDSVNLASRLEGVNKFYSTHICASEDVYNEVSDRFVFRYLDKIRVKGKNVWVNIYELMWKVGEIWVFQENIIKDFEKGLYAYFEKNFQEAKEIFEKLSKLHDAPSKIFQERCELFLQNPPNDDWDGIWTMDEK